MIKLLFCTTLICALSANSLAEKNWGIPTNKSKSTISSYADVIEKYGKSYHKDKTTAKNKDGKKQSEQSNSMNYYNQTPSKTTTKQQGA